MRHRRPGRLGTLALRAALAAPAGADGFVSSRPQIGGRRLHVRQRVVGSTATPCVLLHGLAVSHRYLDPRQAPILAADIRDAGPRRILGHCGTR
jgi:hypothetical protein